MDKMKTWLITGCSSGLGKNMAEVLLENGEQVAVTAWRMETIQEFKERFPDRVFPIYQEMVDYIRWMLQKEYTVSDWQVRR